MRSTPSKLLHAELTDPIIGGCYAVYKKWGFGFLETVYANSLAVELDRKGLRPKREVPVQLTYLGVPVGTYRIDMVVNDKVIVEVKSQGVLSVADEQQLSNYLKATHLEVGLLFNFGPQPTLQRIVFSNDRK